MSPAQNDMDARYLTPGLDQKLRVILMDLFRNAVLLGRSNTVSLEGFLCGLHARYPEEIRGFFQDPDRFIELERKFCLEPAKDMDQLPPAKIADLMRQRLVASGLEIPAISKGQAFALDFPIELSLANVLRKAVTLAATAGREKAGISEFINAFSLDNRLVQQLYRETGLLPKGRLGPEDRPE